MWALTCSSFWSGTSGDWLVVQHSAAAGPTQAFCSPLSHLAFEYCVVLWPSAPTPAKRHMHSSKGLCQYYFQSSSIHIEQESIAFICILQDFNINNGTLPFATSAPLTVATSKYSDSQTSNSYLVCFSIFQALSENIHLHSTFQAFLLNFLSGYFYQH